MWKLYGYDNFAREDYFIAEYATKQEAEQAAEQQRQKLITIQPDESLRDNIWIQAPEN